MSNIRLIHLADIHLGFTGPANLLVESSENEKAAGRYLREVDIENAVRNMTSTIVRADPPVDIVVIAGDLFHRTVPYPRAIRHAARMVRTLAKHDIPVVIIDGNHEVASIVHTGSPVMILKELGALVATETGYACFHNWTHLPEDKQARLEKLAIHALPYKAFREEQFDGIVPLPGYINVLLAHGRVSGMEELNSLHRKAYTIPPTLLRKGWDYVALGDWHIHRHQPLPNVPAFYAGSLEALNFGEATWHPPSDGDHYALRGAVDVRLCLHKPAEIHTLPNQQARPVLRLKPIQAADMDAESIMAQLHTHINASLPANAIVLLEVNDIPSHIWDQLDKAAIEELRQHVRRCDIRWTFLRPSVTSNGEALTEATLESQWQHFIEQNEVNPTEQDWYKNEGWKRIEAARQSLLADQDQEGN